MRTISLTDLRRGRRNLEAALKAGHEILITRHNIPIAKLVGIPADPPTSKRRRRWNPEEHARWQEKVRGGRTTHSDTLLAELRADRKF